MIETITPEAAEKYVRERWAIVRYERGRIWIKILETWLDPFGSDWLAAYAFTRKHECKIAEKRSQIGIIEMAKQVMEHFGYEWGNLGDAILADEKEQLSDLLDGFKEQQK